MKAEYDLSKMKSRKNPYASKLKKPVTMRLGEDVIDYFKAMAEETGVPYQSLINLYLRDCVAQHRKVDILWAKFRPNKKRLAVIAKQGAKLLAEATEQDLGDFTEQ